MTGIGLCLFTGSIVADTYQSFSRPFVIPVRTLVERTTELTVSSSILDSDYQVRFVQWINPTTLKVRASYQGYPSSKDTDLSIELKNHSNESADAIGTEHYVALYPAYEELECFSGGISEEFFPNFLQSSKVFEGEFFSDYFLYEKNEDVCSRLPAMPKGIEPADGQTAHAIYDGPTHSIDLIRAGESERYQLSSDLQLSLASDRTGIVAFAPNQTQASIAVLEVQNSFWAVFSLRPDKLARLIIGPEETSANTGFIPRTLSVAPDEQRWMAYVGPEAEGGRWGISVWDFGSREGEARHVGRVGSKIVAYSEHRGFDHPVVWTGKDSILYLKDDELTLSHVRIKANGKTEELGTYLFTRGRKFSAMGELLGSSWTHDFELFRLEAISAIPLIENNLLRVALVAVLQYSQEGVIKQTALPLVLDLPWDLGDSN